MGFAGAAAVLAGRLWLGGGGEGVGEALLKEGGGGLDEVLLELLGDCRVDDVGLGELLLGVGDV